MFSNKFMKYGLVIFGLFFFVMYVMELDAYARVGGGRSFGSRGSRSYSSPSSPSRAPSSPSSPSRQMGAAPASPSQSGGFLRGLAGGVVGGLIGGMLFRSLGFGGPGTGGGIGLFEIILIGAILYGIWWFIKKKRQAAETNAGNAFYRTASTPEPQRYDYTPTSYGPEASGSDADSGLDHIRQMDSAFDEQTFKDQSMDAFFKIQGSWANRDMSPIRNMMTAEMYGILQGDADDLKRKKQINRLDNIAVRKVEVSEAWQEAGNDFITVRFTANLLDYTTDEATGEVVSGSKTDPVKFEEFWTFTRPVGGGAWQLSAINQV